MSSRELVILAMNTDSKESAYTISGAAINELLDSKERVVTFVGTLQHIAVDPKDESEVPFGDLRRIWQRLNVGGNAGGGYQLHNPTVLMDMSRLRLKGITAIQVRATFDILDLSKLEILVLGSPLGETVGLGIGLELAEIARSLPCMWLSDSESCSFTRQSQC
jgi:hypothetical protein